MFANTQGGAMSMAMPDVCKFPVPSPAGPIPTPMPYPNTAISAMAVPNQVKWMILAMPVHNLGTMVTMTNGDQPGVLGGVISNMIMGPCKHMKGSMKVLAGGMPVTRMMDPTGQNGAAPNAMGTTVKPAQTKVMIMS